MVQQEGAETSVSSEEKAGTNRLSRRQVMGRAGAVATAGVAAWVVPEILVAKPATATGLSGSPGGSTGASVGTSTNVSTPIGGASAGAGASTSASKTAAGAHSGSAASTKATAHARVKPAGAPGPKTRAAGGIDLRRDGEIGAELTASGWALQHWSPNRG